jgi:dihydrofolate synthase/folylpolyglutamate synthase
MTYEQACQFLFGLPSWSKDQAYHPGLERIRRLLDDLGNPDRDYPIVHVAGTNGKGSVSAMIAAMVTAAGHSVGLHTSPHLFSFAERMRVDGVSADDEWIARKTTQLAPSITSIGASFFEASTAIALLYFSEKAVDLAVVEVGMGGRLDATNVVTPAVSVITNIGFDHTMHLGSTLSRIATEKAGIIKAGIPVVSGCCGEEERAVIASVARRLGSTLAETCGTDEQYDLTGIELDLKGRHQSDNAFVAVMAIDLLVGQNPRITSNIGVGLTQVGRLTGLRGRCQVLSRKPVVVADVAHNPDGIRAALEFMHSENLMGQSLNVLLGLSTDKDLGAVLDILAEYDATLIPAVTDSTRLVSPTNMAQSAREKGLRILEIGTPVEILDHFLETSSPGASLLATGSHVVVGALPRLMFESFTTQ